MKKHFLIYKMKFSAPLHISLGKNEYDKSSRMIHSDTLKSALLSCAFYLGYTEKAALELLNGCVLSSAFPFYEDEYFFPKPFAKLMPIADRTEERQGKILKKINFLGQSYFEQLLAGGAGAIEEVHLINDGAYASTNESLIQQSTTKIIAASVNQRVTIAPDYIEDATPFYTERLFFSDKAGLYFMVQFTDSSLESKFHGLIKLLGDNGIGTDRSVGNGFFMPEKASLELNLPDTTSHQLNLSLFCPQKEELAEVVQSDSAWQLIKRGGYLAGTNREDSLSLRKRSVYMFQEGSVFPNVPMTGKIVDLRPKTELVKHPVWRDGRAIFLPIQPFKDDA